MAFKFVCAIIWLGSLLFVGHAEKGEIEVPEAIIQRIYDLVEKGRVKEDAPLNVAQNKINTKGSYKNVIKFNAVGGPIQTALRWLITINDFNAFTPMWIYIALIEAHIYGKAPRPSEKQLISTIEFCGSFFDPTSHQTSSLMTFWPYFLNVNHQNYFSLPVACMKIRNLANTPSDNVDINQQIINKITLEKGMQMLNELSSILTDTENLGVYLMKVLQTLENLDYSADAEDTFVWLGFGSLLTMFGNEFPQGQEKWVQSNSNIISMFDALKKYAYRPFSDDPRVNTIDTTSYYVIRHFLDQSKNAGNDLSLVTTWFTNLEDIVSGGREELHNKIINEVDATVCSNVINGITTAILSRLVSPEFLKEPDINGIYQNTSALVAFLINSNFSGRPDLALLYYPSRYQFYWTVARTVSAMESYKRMLSLPVKVMEVVYNELKQALEGEATKFVLANAKQNDDGSLYYDDFLGNGDVTEDNTPIVRGEDRIFTTAMAANVLMYTWLSFDSVSNKSQWKANTPDSIKKTVKGCILWLTRNALEGRFKPWNAIFCAQNKGTSDLPIRYPANLFLEKPQPYSFQHQTQFHVSVAMRGYVPKAEYEVMINAKQFGKPTPTVFKGFNDPDFSNMVFWSSDPYTYAITLLALSRYREIMETETDFCSL